MVLTPKPLILLALACGVLAVQAAAPSVDVRARALRPGEVILVTVAAPADARVSIRVFDKDWPAWVDGPSRWQSLVGIDLDTKPGRYDLVVHRDDAVAHRALAVEPHAFPTRRLTVDPNLVHAPPEMEARVEREARE